MHVAPITNDARRPPATAGRPARPLACRPPVIQPARSAKRRPDWPQPRTPTQARPQHQRNHRPRRQTPGPSRIQSVWSTDEAYAQIPGPLNPKPLPRSSDARDHPPRSRLHGEVLGGVNVTRDALKRATRTCAARQLRRPVSIATVVKLDRKPDRNARHSLTSSHDPGNASFIVADPAATALSGRGPGW